MTSVQPATSESRDAGFRAVSGGPELASGTTLLVEAYAAIWLLLFAFILLTWRRIGKLETRLGDLERSTRPRAAFTDVDAASGSRGS